MLKHKKEKRLKPPLTEGSFAFNSRGAVTLDCNGCFCLYSIFFNRRENGRKFYSLGMPSWFKIYKIHQHDSQ